PAPELNSLTLRQSSTTLTGIDGTNFNVTQKTGALTGPARLDIRAANASSFTLTLSNSKKEVLKVGYDKTQNQYFIDRSKAGKVDFAPVFAEVQKAPRLAKSDSLNMAFVIDDASIEVFADGGLTTMTAIFFPTEKFSDIQITSPGKLQIGTLKLNPYKSIWKH
ncbi:MAG: GH32 C-terminal domain-containing protein, partial [Chitinophagaceae bacterium]